MNEKKNITTVDSAMLWEMIWFSLKLDALEDASPSSKDLEKIAKKYGVKIIYKEIKK